MALRASEDCNSCDKGNHAHMSVDECGRRMYLRDFYCGCSEPLTTRRCRNCERVIGGKFTIDQGDFLHDPVCHP